MVASITWDDDSVSDGSALSTSGSWNVWQEAGPGVPTSDEHDDHNPGTDLVMDMSNTGVGWAVYTSALDSVDQTVEGEVWPDASSGSGLNSMGVVARQSTVSPSAAGDIDCYMAAVEGPDIFSTADGFDVYLYRVINGTKTQIGSATGVGPAWGGFNACFGLRLIVSTNGSGNVDLEVWVQASNGGSWVEQITYTDTSGSKITTGDYVGRYFQRLYAATNGQPFSRDFDATADGTSGTTGSSATTLARNTASGSGSSTAPATTGSSATTFAAKTASGAGSTGTSGTSATTLVRATASGAGTTKLPSEAGTGVLVLVRHTASANGSTGSVGASGTTLARNTASGSGSATSSGVSGSSATTLVAHSASGAGSTATSGSASIENSTFSSNWNLTVGSGNANDSGAAVYLGGDLYLNDLDAAGTNFDSELGALPVGSVLYIGGWSFTVASVIDNSTHWQYTGTASGELAASGEVTVTHGSGSLNRATASGAGSTTVPGSSGSGAPTMARATASGSGSAGFSGSAAVTLLAHTVSGSGSTGTSGSGALLLERVTALGLPPVTGSAAVTLNRHTLRTSGPLKAAPSQPRPILTRLSVAGKREALRSFDTTRWLDPNFSGSWTNSVDQQNVQYSRVRGRVFVRGVAIGGTGQVFVLPKKFRPPTTIRKSVGTQVFTVGNSGAVTLTTGSSPAYLDFDFSTRG